MPKRASCASSTVWSTGFARANAATAAIFGPCSRRSASMPGSGQRMFSPPAGMSNSGSTIRTRCGSTYTEAELSMVSEIALNATQQPEKRDSAKP